MNKDRRKQLAALHDQLLDLAREVESIKDDEQEAFDNLPEGLQSGDKGSAMEEAIGQLEDVINDIENAAASIEGVATS